MAIDPNKSTVELITTGDGSHSLFNPSLNETYHSRYGALQESQHVFIANGLGEVKSKTPIRILEVGFGTGLNAFLTANYAEANQQRITYTSLETYPLDMGIWETLNYASGNNEKTIFRAIHQVAWEKPQVINAWFTLTKNNCRLQDYKTSDLFNLIYFDAFGPPVQPEMWTIDIFNKLFDLLEKDGILVTYCAKGQVRRNMQSVGFSVERLQGPPGKREMLRATKTSSQL